MGKNGRGCPCLMRGLSSPGAEDGEAVNVRLMPILVAMLFVAGCTPTATVTPTGGVTQHLYVGNDNVAGGVQQYTLPLFAGETANFLVAFPSDISLGLDASGDLAVGDNAGNLKFFSNPLSGTSVAAASFKNGTGSNDGGIVFNSAGAFFVSTFGAAVNMFTPPFSNASTPALTLTTGLVSAGGLALDSAANLYVGNSGVGTALTCTSGATSCSNIVVYASPYTGAPTVGTNIASTAYRNVAVSATQLFAASVAGATGRIDVYTLPITAASTPAFAITTGVNTPEGVAVDASGNLYVGNLSNAVVTVYAPPFSAASAPTVSLTVSTGAFAIFGISVGK